MKLVYTIKYSKVARIHRVLSFFGGGGAGGGGGGCEEVNAKGMRDSVGKSGMRQWENVEIWSPEMR